jgi:hypothetical protein
MRTTNEIRAEIKRLKWQMKHKHAQSRELIYADGALAALEWLLSEKLGSASGRNKNDLVASLKSRQIQHCRRCGCTEDYACIGGCGWVEPKDEYAESDLCTKCV